MVKAGAMLLACVCGLTAQSVSVAKWRGNAKGAYSVVMDDFGGSDLGFAQYADTMYTNRGIRVSLAVVAGAGTPANWAYARDLRSRGFEFINHSWSHRNDWGPSDFALEIDSAKAVIEREIPGNRALFFCYPYEIITDTMVGYLRRGEHIGSRGGNFHSRGLNPPMLPDPFRSQFLGYDPTTGTSSLNTQATDATTTGGWGLRETHNVGTSGDYAIRPDTLAAHLDHCRQLIDQGLLWMAPVQEAVMYARERECYTVSVAANGLEELRVTFGTTTTTINPSGVAPNTLYDYPLTLKLVPQAGFTVQTVTQGGSALAWTTSGDTVLFDAAPYGGVVTVASISAASSPRTEEICAAGARADTRAFLLNGAVVCGSVRPWHVLAAQTGALRVLAAEVSRDRR